MKRGERVLVDSMGSDLLRPWKMGESDHEVVFLDQFFHEIDGLG